MARGDDHPPPWWWRVRQLAVLMCPWVGRCGPKAQSILRLQELVTKAYAVCDGPCCVEQKGRVLQRLRVGRCRPSERQVTCGETVGLAVGVVVGAAVVGDTVGLLVCSRESSYDSRVVGASDVGEVVGPTVGARVGDAVSGL